MELKVNNISFNYDSISVLKDVSFKISSGEVLGVIGANGSGKTTLLKCINRVLKPQGGIVYLGEKELSFLNRKEIAKKIGVVPQRSYINFPFTVYEVVSIGRYPHVNFFSQENAEDFEIVDKVLKKMRIESLKERRIDEISGGEFQKVIIARALAQKPKVLLLDEPTLHLDIKYQLEILKLIRELTEEQNLIVIMVTHDLFLSLPYFDSLLLLKEGRIYAAGRRKDVLTPENIKEVYGVEVKIIEDTERNFLSVIPIK